MAGPEDPAARPRPAEAADPVALAPEVLDLRPTEGLAVVAGRPVALSRLELDLLGALAGRAGHVVDRERLYAAAWGGRLRPGDRIVDVYVRRLRVKLAAAVGSGPWIHTHVGYGYRLDPPAGVPVSHPGPAASRPDPVRPAPGSSRAAAPPSQARRRTADEAR